MEQSDRRLSQHSFVFPLAHITYATFWFDEFLHQVACTSLERSAVSINCRIFEAIADIYEVGKMTPDKAKKPLPASKSVAFLEQPSTQYEWRYVLKVAKVEYQKGRFKQCLVRCNTLLNTGLSPLPLHTTCLNFYFALSEEAIARQMHDMSMAKIEKLQHAKSCFERAILSLPQPDVRYNINEPCSTDSGSENDDTASLDDSVSSVGSHQPTAVVKMSLKDPAEQPSPSPGSRKPLPLQICTAIQNGNSSFNEKRAFFEAKLAASNSTPSRMASPKSPAVEEAVLSATPALDRSPPNYNKPLPSPESDTTGICSPAQERYNEQLHEFAQMLQMHISSVDRLVATTREAQATGRRRLIKERKDQSGIDDENAMDLRTRIIRLKAKGWVRDRFIPEKYQKLCERALAEL